MFRTVTVFAALVAVVAMGCTPADGPVDASVVIMDARTAMGMDNLDSIAVSGTANNLTNFQQSQSISNPALVPVANFTRAVDLNGSATRATGEMMVVGLFGGDPAPTPLNQVGTADSGWAQQMELWLTPWGFLEGAAANNAEAVREGDTTIVTWMTPDSVTAPSGLSYTVRGYIDADNRVERVETWLEDNIAGDMPVQAIYGNYMDVDGVMVPGSITEMKAGVTYFTAAITDAEVNPANIAELVTTPTPPAGRGGRGGRGGGGGGGGRGGAPPAPVDLAEQLDEGVWRITGGYVSLVVEFAEDVVVFETGQNIARGNQVLAEVERLFPDKPIRYVVNSHPHSDHTGGLPAVVAAGIPILTHENNVEFLRSALSNPRTLLADDDALKVAGTAPMIEGVGNLMVLEDDTMRLELHHVQDNGHTDGMLVAYLPESQILFQADFTLPGPDAAPNDFVVTLGENVERLGLDFERYYAVHDAGALQTRADFDAALSRAGQ